MMVGLTGAFVAAAIAVIEGSSWSVAVLFASDTAAAVFVTWVWLTVVSRDATTTARIARSEDASRAAAETVLIGAGAASLVAGGPWVAAGGPNPPPPAGGLRRAA